jgi:hypothetical protein
VPAAGAAVVLLLFAFFFRSTDDVEKEHAVMRETDSIVS